MSKDDIITLALDYQDKFNSSLANINKDLRELKYKFEKLESELAVSKQSILISVILLFVFVVVVVEQRNIIEAAIDCCSAKDLFFFCW